MRNVQLEFDKSPFAACGVFPCSPVAHRTGRPRQVLHSIGIAMYAVPDPSPEYVEAVRRGLRHHSVWEYRTERNSSGIDILVGGYCGGPYDLTEKALAILELEREAQHG